MLTGKARNFRRRANKFTYFDIHFRKTHNVNVDRHRSETLRHLVGSRKVLNVGHMYLISIRLGCIYRECKAP